MIFIHQLNTILLLSAYATASLQGWTYQGPSTLIKRYYQPHAGNRSIHTIPPGGFVSNGILWLTTTVYLKPGENLPATTSVVSSQALSAPQAPPTSQASQPPSVTPPVNPTTQAAPAAPTPEASSPQQKKPPAQPASSAAAPPAQPPTGDVKAGAVTSEMVSAIAPKSTSCDPAANFGNECATAAQAAPALNKVFAKYGIDNAGAQAAVIAWITFESGEFKYKMNHFPEPGRPGQGTRSMMMPPFVAEYATQLVGEDKVKAAGAPDKVLDLVNGDDEGSFGGGAWFMKEKCGNLLGQFATSPDTAWASFITSCVETTATPERDVYWTSAKKALGV